MTSKKKRKKKDPLDKIMVDKSVTKEQIQAAIGIRTGIMVGGLLGDRPWEGPGSHEIVRYPKEPEPDMLGGLIDLLTEAGATPYIHASDCAMWTPARTCDRGCGPRAYAKPARDFYPTAVWIDPCGTTMDGSPCVFYRDVGKGVRYEPADRAWNDALEKAALFLIEDLSEDLGQYLATHIRGMKR